MQRVLECWSALKTQFEITLAKQPLSDNYFNLIRSVAPIVMPSEERIPNWKR